MMFNWKQKQQVGVTLWPEVEENEDHIVPHSAKTEENLPSFREYNKVRENESVNTAVRSSEQSFQAKNDCLSYKSIYSSDFPINEGCSSPITEMDPWVDFSDLCDELSDKYVDGNHQNSMMTEMVNDLTDSTYINPVQGSSLHLNHEPELFGKSNKETGDFLDCDWSTFGDFDDIETLFSNDDSIFGHHIGDAAGFVSSSKDLIYSTAQSIPIPDLPSSKERASDEACVSFDEGDLDGERTSSFRKEKVDGQKVLSTSLIKAVKIKNKLSRNLTDNLYPNYRQKQHGSVEQFAGSIAPSMPTLPSIEISNPMQLDGANLMENHGSSGQVTGSGCGYPSYRFYGIPLAPPVHIEGNSSFNSKTSKKEDEKPVSMTPQEKIEKLRRLQQMQAQLAIEQQQQQYASVASQSTNRIDGNEQNVQSSLLEMLTEQELKRNRSLSYDPTIQESIYYQLQDVVCMLDTRIRLCIRDSLLRLAKSAMERQSAGDRNSTTKCNKDEDEVSANQEAKKNDSVTWLADSETDTNPIDRIVASLLFQRPSGRGPKVDICKLLG